MRDFQSLGTTDGRVVESLPRGVYPYSKSPPYVHKTDIRDISNLCLRRYRMKKGIDIYNYERMFEATVRTMRSSKITELNKKLIEKFYNFCYANGIGKPRIIKYVRTLRQLAEWLKKDFDKATKQDIEKVVTAIQQRDDYSEWTKKDFNVALKKFYKWLKGNEDYPPEVKWLKTRPNMSKVKLPGQDGLLTEDDIKKLVEATDHPRNKALISLLYESGCRVGEIASLQIALHGLPLS